MALTGGEYQKAFNNSYSGSRRACPFGSDTVWLNASFEKARNTARQEYKIVNVMFSSGDG